MYSMYNEAKEKLAWSCSRHKEAASYGTPVALVIATRPAPNLESDGYGWDYRDGGQVL